MWHSASVIQEALCVFGGEVGGGGCFPLTKMTFEMLLPTEQQEKVKACQVALKLKVVGLYPIPFQGWTSQCQLCHWKTSQGPKVSILCTTNVVLTSWVQTLFEWIRFLLQTGKEHGCPGEHDSCTERAVLPFGARHSCSNLASWREHLHLAPLPVEQETQWRAQGMHFSAFCPLLQEPFSEKCGNSGNWTWNVWCCIRGGSLVQNFTFSYRRRSWFGSWGSRWQHTILTVLKLLKRALLLWTLTCGR